MRNSKVQPRKKVDIVLIPDPKNSPILQAYDYDPTSAKIEVVHYINLNKGQDVLLKKIEKYMVIAKQDKLDMNIKNIRAIEKDNLKVRYHTTFIYQLIPSSIRHPRTKVFPLNGNPYPLSHLPHDIEVRLDPISILK